MGKKEPVQITIDYIDKHIGEYLSAGRLSAISNYSVPQLFRLFTHDMGITPAKYALRRRLYFAAWELAKSNRKVIDIAYFYGFESQDSFCRAFKRVYGVAPGAFRKEMANFHAFYHSLHCIAGCAVPESISETGKEVYSMSECVRKQEYEKFRRTYGNDVDIVTVPATKLIGVCRPVGGGAWEAFYEAYDKIFRNAPNRRYPNSHNATHGIPRFSPGGETLYFVGIEVTGFDTVPEGAMGIELPEQLCAVVGFEGGIDYDTIHYYFEKWTATQNEYKPDTHKIDPLFSEKHAWKTYAPIWEYYTPNRDCDVYEERIYMPVKKA